MIISLLIGYTFAKYYTSYRANGSLRAAKWSFKVTGWSTEEINNLTLENFETQNSSIDLEEGIMAPGFYGSMDLEFDATGSEVDVAYNVETTESGMKPSNMYFITKINNEESRRYATLEELAENELSGTILKSDANKIKNITICAIWPYETESDDSSLETEDEEDTAVGTGTVEGQEDEYDYTFSLKVVATQAII